MKRIKRYGIWLLAVLLFTSCASENPVSAPPTEAVSKETKTPESEALYLSLASCGNWTDSPQGIILAEQLEKLEEQSGGLVKIRSYDRYRLGDDVRVVHGVRLGTLDMIQSVPGRSLRQPSWKCRGSLILWTSGTSFWQVLIWMLCGNIIRQRESNF